MKFKKFLLPALTCFAALFSVASCDNGTDFHQILFPNNPYGTHQLFADQESDTVLLYSTDSWQANTINADWFSISPTNVEIKPMSPLLHKITLNCTPNTTGKNRTGHIQVKGHETIWLSVVQRGYLHILAPSAVVNDSTLRFACEMSSTEGNSKVQFCVYKDGATLKSNVDWLTPDSTQFAAGMHTIRFNVTANPDTTRRNGILTLTSNGISTPIEISQLPRSK